jgi:mRNA-degrading endonuclease RelE of RelBE toxin-antitoxin system
VKIQQTPTFQRVYKKLYAKERLEVDAAIQAVVADPAIGQAKVGDLAGVRVHKFKVTKRLTLLAYTYEDKTVTLTLLALGSHENFYRDLKK